MSALYVFLRHFIALIYPTRCPICKKVIGAMEGFCNECSNELIKYNYNFKIPKVRKFVSAFEYNEKISPAIFTMKDSNYGNSPYAFGTVLSEIIKAEGINADFIVPVPLYNKNLRRRRYNHAESIAKEIGRTLNIKVNSNIVIKNRKTLAQKSLTKAERKINLKNAFSVTDKSEVKNKCILIVDDVCTTGSTLAEITNLLIDCGANEIYCACACKTPELKRGEY